MPDDETPKDFPKWDYQEYPKTLPRDDFWGQVRRTIMGRRISETEVALIVDHIRDQLRLRRSDTLLDIGCGNGALSARLFDDCAGYVGVDLSPYLIEVAQEFFERPPTHLFFNSDAAQFVEFLDEPGRFTKGLCFATLQYLPLATVRAVLQILSERFPNLCRVLLGNLPNREKADLFFNDGYNESDLQRHESQVGKWWSTQEIGCLASSFGWEVSYSRMSANIFNAKYRFDAILTRCVSS
ncbi:MAG: class I SAM-dependent methyltransferase [Acidimicrobiales bacterium]